MPRELEAEGAALAPLIGAVKLARAAGCGTLADQIAAATGRVPLGPRRKVGALRRVDRDAAFGVGRHLDVQPGHPPLAMLRVCHPDVECMHGLAMTAAHEIVSKSRRRPTGPEGPFVLLGAGAADVARRCSGCFTVKPEAAAPPAKGA